LFYEIKQIHAVVLNDKCIYFYLGTQADIHIVKNGSQPKTKTKGDTLYADKTLVLLGDITEVKSPGIYKKFRFKSKFENFKVDQIYKGVLVKPDFSKDPDAKMFNTQIKQGCESLGVNFAGHFTIIEWGCGTSCQRIAIIDRINGDILFSKIPFDTLDGHCGLDFRKDSRMIIVNTVALDGVEGFVSNYGRKPCIYEINKSELIRVE
jgi:hypothetical protein